MTIIQESFKVVTHRRNEFVDITDHIGRLVENSKVKNGEVVVFCPHTTAAITINENADPSVIDDVLLTLSELIPHHRAGYRHSEGNSDAHTKSSLVGCSEHILIKDGSLTLGTWQGVYFCEFDGPRTRQVIVQIKGV